MFLLFLGYQHNDSGWTFIDIGPYSIDSMEITFMPASQLTFYKLLVHGLLNLRLCKKKKRNVKQCFTLEEQNVSDTQFGRAVNAPSNVHIFILRIYFGMNSCWY